MPTVAVKIPNGNGPWLLFGFNPALGKERSVTQAEKDRDIIQESVCHGQVLISVGIEVFYGHRGRVVADGKSALGKKRPIA